MYSDEDDDDDMEFDEELSEERMFDDWFWYYQNLVHPDLKQGREPKPMVADFYSGIYKRIMSDLKPAVRQLAYKQYPDLAGETRPKVCRWMDHCFNQVGCCFLIQLFGLVYDEQINTNLREKYPDLEDWKIKYARPYDPMVILNQVFENAPWLTEAQKQEIIDEDAENFGWKEVRQGEFFDMIQQSVLKHYPRVENLSADGWIVYAFLLHMEHTEYRLDIEFVADFIHCGLTEEEVDLPSKEIYEKISQFYHDEFNPKSTMDDAGNNN